MINLRKCLLGFFSVVRFDKMCFGILNLESSLFLKQVLPATVMLKQPGKHWQMFVINVCVVQAGSLTLILKLSTSAKLPECNC